MIKYFLQLANQRDRY